jgi:hypothetical protein
VDETDITAKGIRLKDIRQKVGLVFQYPEHQLFEETVYKDVAYGLWSWLDSAAINGSANTDDFGFHDIAWKDGGGTIQMKDITIDITFKDGVDTIYFN